jgi:hypothetical protein
LASLPPEVKALIREHFANSAEDIVPPKLVDEFLGSSSVRALMVISKVVGIDFGSPWRFLAKYALRFDLGFGFGLHLLLHFLLLLFVFVVFFVFLYGFFCFVSNVFCFVFVEFISF